MLVPGAGPNLDMPGNPTHTDADLMQASVYTGFKKLHGIKNLSMQLANGLSFIFGPISARR